MRFSSEYPFETLSNGKTLHKMLTVDETNPEQQPQNGRGETPKSMATDDKRHGTKYIKNKKETV